MKKYSMTLAIILSILSCFSVNMDEKVVKPDTLNIGTPMSLVLSFSSSVDSISLVLPDTLSTLDFNVTDVIREKEGVSGASIYFAPFETGQVILPSFEVETWKDEIPELHNTRQYTFLVQSVLPDSGAVLREISGPEKVYLNFWDYLLIVAVIATLILIIWLITKIPKKELQKEIKKKPEIVIPAWEIALQSLKRLKETNLPSNGKFLDFYFELSLILRRLLEGHYMFNAAEMTTYEINEVLSELKVEDRIEIKSFLQKCDMIKYAKQLPSIEEAEKDYNWVLTYTAAVRDREMARIKDLEKEKQNV